VVADAAAAPSPRVALRGARRQPRAATLRGLARLAAARGDDDAADNLQARAAAIAERAPRPTRYEKRLWRPDRCAGAGGAGGPAVACGRVPGEASRPVVRRGQRLPRLGAAPWPEGPRPTPTERRIPAEGSRGPATRRMLGVP
jgi:hypothetical protein